MGLLILFGQIGDRVGLPIVRAKTQNLPAKEAGTPVLGFPLSHYKSFLSGSPPEGLRKHPISWGLFFLTYYSLYYIFDSS
jgi:hypothetical protein